MGVRTVYFSFVLFGLLQLVRLRSIDQVIEDVETEFEKNFTGPMSKFPSRVWFDYEVRGRTEELVKLQLDLIVTKETWDKVIDTNLALPSRGKRNAVKDPTRLWPRRIPYIINEEFDCEGKYKLLMAMDHWEEHTCLNFVEANITTDFDLIEFVPVDYGCESMLGRMQGRQPINLAKPCMYKEIIVHEIGHAVGLYHEHMRHDRDDYVIIHYQNINETYHRQFDKLRGGQYSGHNKPYDYESVMHYGKLFYSLNRSEELITIEPKDKVYLDAIGEAPSLSYFDVKIVNQMYKCSEGCLSRTCPGDGFLGKNCQCYCKGETAYDIVLCETADPCGKPDINLKDYFVFTRNYENNITVWNTEAYPDGTHLIVEHKNETCGYMSANFSCRAGEWEGEIMPCEKACIVEDFGDDYVVSNSTGEQVQPRDHILSRDQIAVVCRDRKSSDNIQEEYITCTDGQWNKNIGDIVCIRERTQCPMVINAQLGGTFEDGFKVNCLEGFEMDLHGDAVARFNCSWDGKWEPFMPTCKPANCTVPMAENAIGSLFDKNLNELFRGAEIIHGSDVTLYCPKGHVPDDVKVSCHQGRFNKEPFPVCTPVMCPKPTVVDALYQPKQDVYMYGDVVRVGRCKGLFVLEGSRELSCLKNGTWSDSATCGPFCEGGEEKIETRKSTEMKAVVRYRRRGMSSYDACGRSCLRHKRFLCRAFVFGMENGRRQCRMYAIDPDERPDVTQKRLFWTMGIRKCHRN